MNKPLLYCLLSASLLCLDAPVVAQHVLFDLGTGTKSRSISFENPTGEPGEGGKAASVLGVGRKGAASRRIAPGETVVLCDITNSGTIRHLWMTGTFTKQQFTPEWERNHLLEKHLDSCLLGWPGAPKY